MKAALLLLALAPSLAAQEHKPMLDKAQWTLLAADASVHAYDTYATRRMIENDGRELFLPPFVVDHAATMAAFSVAVVGAQTLVQYQLTKRGHRRMAKALAIFDVSATATAASLAMQVTRLQPITLELPHQIR